MTRTTRSAVTAHSTTTMTLPAPLTGRATPLLSFRGLCHDRWRDRPQGNQHADGNEQEVVKLP